jgi:hypothetical protein
MNKYLQKIHKKTNQSKKKKKTKNQLQQQKTKHKKKTTTQKLAHSVVAAYVHLYISSDSKSTNLIKRRVKIPNIQSVVVNRRRAVFESTIGPIFCSKS